MPTTQSSLASLLVQVAASAIYAKALQIATTLGLPVTSWQAGDPTRSAFNVVSQIIGALEPMVVGFVQSGFLDYAATPNADGTPNPWLPILAKEVYDVDVPSATYAETTLTLTNTSGAEYTLDPGDLTVSNPTTGATYHNTSAITLTPTGTTNSTGTVDIVADDAGHAGSAAAGDINSVVSGFTGLECTNPDAAEGVDEQAAETTVSQCRDKLGSLSPNGPAAAYTYVVLNSELTGTPNITRARTYPSSQNGQFPIYVASPSGVVDDGDLTLAQAAVNTWAQPQCFTATVQSANPVTVNVTYSLWLYSSVTDSEATVEANVESALAAFFSERPIGGDIIPPASTGSLYQSMLAAEIAAVYGSQTLRVVVSAPSSDTTLNNGDVPVLGTPTATVTFVPVPT